MNNRRRQTRLLLLSAAIVMAPLTSAQAQGVDAALERFKVLFEDQGISINWKNARISGDDAVLEDVTLATAEDEFGVSNISFEDIVDDPEGYRVASISMDDISVDGEENFSLSVRGIGMNDILLPNDNVRDNYGGFIFYERAHIDDIRVYNGDTEVVALTDSSVTVTPASPGSPMTYRGLVDHFSLDLSMAEGSEQWPIIEALGYQRMTGKIESSGTWDPENGQLELTANNFTVDNAGTLGFSFNLGGYTRELVASLREIQKTFAENPEGDNSAQGLAMLGLMQQMGFKQAELSFADDSLTGKVLELVAQMQGMSKSDVVAIAKGAVPFAVAQLGSSDFTTAATRAVSTFLDDPKNIRITAKPANEVPFALIMAEGMSTPQGLIKTLNVTATAND